MAHSSEHANEEAKMHQASRLKSGKVSTTPDKLPTDYYPLCLQGYHELEYSEADDESNLREKRKHCSKNPGHLNFIPVKEFTMDHLPCGYRYQVLMDQIQSVIDLTVGIKINFTCKSRPDKPYPMSFKRGKRGTAHGTGMIFRVHRPYDMENDETCFCSICGRLPEKDRKKQWGEYSVRTAMHVVYNDYEESRYTQFYVDYNTDADRDTCPKLYGLLPEGGDLQTDMSMIRGFSHDKDLCTKLEKRVHHFLAFTHKYDPEIPQREAEDRKRAIVCVSHPHGMSKHVSIGEWRGEEEKGPYRWRYTTATCPGSSGAPIFDLGNVKGKVFPGWMTTHSGARNSSENESGGEGYWWA